jgi:L-aspartate oxidase
MGAIFDRGPDGKLGLGLEAAHTKPRIIHSGGDRTGAALISCLAEVVRCLPEIEILEHTEVTSLLVDEGKVVGVGTLSATGSSSIIAPAVVLATGGVGQLYDVTTNPRVATADGWALAHQAGAQLRDIEFLQFHPTALKLPDINPAPLISEAVRGAGALLVDQAGKRFTLDHDPRGELGPRDIVARAVAAADSSGGAWLDARKVENFPTRFPGITAMLARVGLNPIRDLVPVAPALHYAMGGIETDLDGRTTIMGLWAVGEVARTGVHGANRLASNSLLEGLVFADRAGRALSKSLPSTQTPNVTITAPAVSDTGADTGCKPIRAEMRRLMTAHVGLQRSESSLLHAERELERLVAATLPAAWRTQNQLLVAGLITQAARGRRESRGGHRRTDYPPPTRKREAV